MAKQYSVINTFPATPHMVELIDRYARRNSISKAAAIRDLIDFALESVDGEQSLRKEIMSKQAELSALSDKLAIAERLSKDDQTQREQARKEEEARAEEDYQLREERRRRRENAQLFQRYQRVLDGDAIIEHYDPDDPTKFNEHGISNTYSEAAKIQAERLGWALWGIAGKLPELLQDNYEALEVVL